MEPTVHTVEDDLDEISQKIKPLVGEIEKGVSARSQPEPKLDDSIAPFVPASSDSHLELLRELRKRDLVKSLRPEDLLLGRWCSSDDEYILIDLQAREQEGKKEDISDLSLQARCKIDHASPQVFHISNSVDLRVRVLSIDRGIIYVTTKPLDGNSPRLGLLTEEQPTTICHSPKRLNSLLEADVSFKNPHSVEYLARNFIGLSPDEDSKILCSWH